MEVALLVVMGYFPSGGPPAPQRPPGLQGPQGPTSEKSNQNIPFNTMGL